MVLHKHSISPGEVLSFVCREDSWQCGLLVAPLAVLVIMHECGRAYLFRCLVMLLKPLERDDLVLPITHLDIGDDGPCGTVVESDQFAEEHYRILCVKMFPSTLDSPSPIFWYGTDVYCGKKPCACISTAKKGGKVP